MGLEIRVHCEHPGCDETEMAVGHEDENFDVSSTVDRLPDGARFHFFIDTGWIYAPEGWVLGGDDQILCPHHAPAEAPLAVQPPPE